MKENESISIEFKCVAPMILIKRCSAFFWPFFKRMFGRELGYVLKYACRREVKTNGNQKDSRISFISR
ncbi:hypothetical protein, partial [Lactobacillus delbrueckii]